MVDSPAHRNLVVPADASGQRLDSWLVSQLPEISRVRVQQLIEQKKVTVNGSAPKPSLKLHGGEQVVVTGEVELAPLRAFAEDIPLDIVYEDQSMAVVNKPAGMVVHVGSGKDGAGSKGTLVNALLHRFRHLSQVGGEFRPGIVHRLDKETSGLLVVAKTDNAHRKLAQQFSRREVRKTYVALVHGGMKKPQGTVAAPISRDLVRRARMTTRRSDGREAVTRWKLLKEINGPYGKFSLLEVKIETGRTHQIRVHLAALGHPVVGDTLYGAPREISAVTKGVEPPITLARNFLHAAAIQLKKPDENTLLSLEQPLPAELESFLRQIGG
ncbi:MAG TPA: RluA family pseudouridine synthase [Verrucomicrobiae bacterium]|nr:RluA family pseudouridine synthase [Verrucomicrobiae bacterium]